MQTEFPRAEDGFAGQLIVGFRKASPGGPTEMVAAAVVKRRYSLNGVTGAMMPILPPPNTPPEPPFVGDVLDNLAERGGFTGDAGVTVSEASGEITVHRTSGTGSRAVLSVLLPDDLIKGSPVDGIDPKFSFRCSARGGDAINGTQLERDGSEVTAELSGPTQASTFTDFEVKEATFPHVTPPVVTPGSSDARTLKIVLAAGTSAPLVYRNIQVTCAYALRYEYDLVPYKPASDIVVLRYDANVQDATISIDPGTSPEVLWATWTAPVSAAEPRALFGWMQRGVAPRDAHFDIAGQPPEWPPPFSAPLYDPLPADFKNEFYNGGQRLAAAPQYVRPGDTVFIRRTFTTSLHDVYRLTLPARFPEAQLYSFAGAGADIESNWTQTPLSMVLDTLVVEPDANRCYAVWRAVFPFDPSGPNRKVVVQHDA